MRTSRPKEKMPVALARADAAKVQHRTAGYPLPPIAPSPGLRIAGYWLVVGDRVISAIYRMLTDTHGPAVCAVIQTSIDNDLIVKPEQFGSKQQGNLLRVLVAIVEAGLKPTPWLILAVARRLDWAICDDGGDELAVVTRVLECESSAAGLNTWTARLRECGLRQRMTLVLCSTYSRLLDPCDPLVTIISECAANLDAWRAEAQRVTYG